MKPTICGLDCSACGYLGQCAGCTESGGKPFGGTCMVAMCCSTPKNRSCGDFAHGVCALKRQIIDEFNALAIPDMDEVTDLYALVGSYINVQYTSPGGEQFRLWDDRRIYLGNQLPKKNSDRCYGLTADERYLLVCEYGEGGADAEIVVFARRKIKKQGDSDNNENK